MYKCYVCKKQEKFRHVKTRKRQKSKTIKTYKIASDWRSLKVLE